VDTSTSFTEGDVRTTIPRFTEENRAVNLALVDHVRQVAEAKKASPGQVALAWLLAQHPWIVPIPGTRRLERLQENLGGVDVVLTPDDLAAIELAASDISVQGARYPEALEALTGR